jgi:long-chain acyl-CoA synthetase
MKLEILIVSKGAYPSLNGPCHIIYLDMRGKISGIQKQGKRIRPESPHPDSALILYTSGSEGEAKGVILSQGAIEYTVRYLIDYFSLQPSTNSACLLPLSHTMGLNTQFLPSFFAGGTSLFYETSLILNQVYRRLIESEADFVGLTSDLINLCHAEKERRRLDPAVKIQHVQIAAGIIRKSHLEMARKIFPNATIHKGYGLTEAIRVSMINSKDPKFELDSAGYLLPGQQVRILDSNGQQVPPNTIGKIYIKGPNIMLGYDNLDNPSRMKNGYLNTGDLGAVTADNRLVIHGRHDSIFKVNGERVSCREIENAVQAVYAKFKNVQCIPLEFKDGLRPIVFIEAKTGLALNFLSNGKYVFERQLIRILKMNIKVPKTILFIDQFPRALNGKICIQSLKGICNNREEWHHRCEAKRKIQYCIVSEHFADKKEMNVNYANRDKVDFRY